MKIVLVGASGTIGKAVDANLSSRHDIIRVNRSSGDFRIDLADPRSIEDFYEKVGSFDALVCATGRVHFGLLETFTLEKFEVGLRSKLMGQVNLVMSGLKNMRDNGSFTLTSGLLNEEPIREGLSAAMVNGGIEGFVRAAAIVLPRGLRINVVSPTIVEESLPSYGPYFPGAKAVSASEVALGYVKSVEGAQSGRIYRIGWTRDF